MGTNVNQVSIRSGVRTPEKSSRWVWPVALCYRFNPLRRSYAGEMYFRTSESGGSGCFNPLRRSYAGEIALENRVFRFLGFQSAPAFVRRRNFSLLLV